MVFKYLVLVFLLAIQGYTRLYHRKLCPEKNNDFSEQKNISLAQCFLQCELEGDCKGVQVSGVNDDGIVTWCKEYTRIDLEKRCDDKADPRFYHVTPEGAVPCVGKLSFVLHDKCYQILKDKTATSGRGKCKEIKGTFVAPNDWNTAAEILSKLKSLAHEKTWKEVMEKGLFFDYNWTDKKSKHITDSSKVNVNNFDPSVWADGMPDPTLGTCVVAFTDYKLSNDACTAGYNILCQYDKLW